MLVNYKLLFSLLMSDNIPSIVYLYRITHCGNLPFILKNGLYCPASPNKDEHYINIGKKDIITKREHKPVVYEPYGYIHDYVSFYFGPRSPMLYVISKGSSDTNCRQEDIVYIVTGIPTLQEHKKAFIFTDGQALMELSNQYTNIPDLNKIDWDIIFGKDWFDKPPSITDRKRKRQAELLVYEHVPVACINSLAVMNKKARILVERMVSEAGLLIPVTEKPQWYY